MSIKEEIAKVLETPKLWVEIRWQDLNKINAFWFTGAGYEVLSRGWPGIELHCPLCNRATTYTCRGGGFFGGAASNIEAGLLLTVTYECQRCVSHTRQFVFGTKGAGDGTKFVKFAAWPAQRPRSRNAVKDILDKEKADFFRRGMMCEQHGLGMGAHAYYRRIVETSIEEWLDELKAVTGEEGHQEWLDKHDGRPQMGEQIDRLQHFMHDSIAGDGKAPINALYSTLSKGLHSLPEDDCLVLAEALRELLVFTLIKISEMRDKGDLIQDAQNKLNNLKSKLANPQQQSKG